MDTGERAVFSRNEVFLFGTCLAKMDLAFVLSSSDKVKLVTEPIDDSQKLMEYKEKYGGLEVYRRAKLVWVGETPKYYKSPDDQSKFLVDKKLNGLCQYLNKRNVSIEKFADELVTGLVGKMAVEGSGNKVPLTAASLMAASDLRGQLVELKRPDCGNLKKDTVNGKYKTNSHVFKRIHTISFLQAFCKYPVASMQDSWHFFHAILCTFSVTTCIKATLWTLSLTRRNFRWS